MINRGKPLAIITKRSILDIAAALDPPLIKNISAVVAQSKHSFNDCLNLAKILSFYVK